MVVAAAAATLALRRDPARQQGLPTAQVELAQEQPFGLQAIQEPAPVGDGAHRKGGWQPGVGRARADVGEREAGQGICARRPLGGGRLEGVQPGAGRAGCRRRRPHPLDAPAGVDRQEDRAPDQRDRKKKQDPKGEDAVGDQGVQAGGAGEVGVAGGEGGADPVEQLAPGAEGGLGWGAD